MKLSFLLNRLGEIAKEEGLSPPHIVGGFPRDMAMNISNEIEDIDITTGDVDSLSIAMLSSREWPNAHFRTYDDGHSSLRFSNIRMDFSNNFKLPGIEDELKRMGKNNISALEKELYSRDFTVNTLLQPMDLSVEALDLTGMAKDDVKNRVLRTPVNPRLTIGHDPKRILRALKMAIKLGFTLDSELEKTIIDYRGGIKDLSLGYVKSQVNQMLKLDSNKALELLVNYKLLPIIPLSKMMTLEISKNHMVQHLLDGEVK